MTERRQARNLIEFRINDYAQFVIPTPEKIKRAKTNPYGRLLAAAGVLKALRQMTARIAALTDDTAIELHDSEMATLEQIASVIGIEAEVMARRLERRRAEVARAHAEVARVRSEEKAAA